MAHPIGQIPPDHESKTCRRRHTYDRTLHDRCPMCRLSRMIAHRALINTDEINRKATVVLAREIEHLLTKSTVSPLDSEEAKNLINYLKALREIRKEELEELKALTPEQMELMLKKG